VTTPVIPRCGRLLAPAPRAEDDGHSRMPSEQRPLCAGRSDVSCYGRLGHVKKCRGTLHGLGRHCPSASAFLACVNHGLTFTMVCIDRAARRPDSTQDGLCAEIQGRRGPHIQHDSMRKPLLNIESGAARWHCVRNRISQVRHDWCRACGMPQIQTSRRGHSRLAKPRGMHVMRRALGLTTSVAPFSSPSERSTPPTRV
jgi:hypothetical protein